MSFLINKQKNLKNKKINWFVYHVLIFLLGEWIRDALIVHRAIGIMFAHLGLNDKFLNSRTFNSMHFLCWLDRFSWTKSFFVSLVVLYLLLVISMVFDLYWPSYLSITMIYLKLIHELAYTSKGASTFRGNHFLIEYLWLW